MQTEGFVSKHGFQKPESSTKLVLVSMIPGSCLLLTMAGLKQLAIVELIFDSSLPEVCTAAIGIVTLTIVTRIQLLASWPQAAIITSCFMPIGLLLSLVTLAVSFFMFLLASVFVSGLFTLFAGNEARFP